MEHSIKECPAPTTASITAHVHFPFPGSLCLPLRLICFHGVSLTASSWHLSMKLPRSRSQLSFCRKSPTLPARINPQLSLPAFTAPCAQSTLHIAHDLWLQLPHWIKSCIRGHKFQGLQGQVAGITGCSNLFMGQG